MMKRIYAMGMAAGLAVLGAAAQNEDAAARKAKVQLELNRMDLEKQVAEAKVIGLAGGVMGPPVKGAPYSADEVRESNQVLADGTRIHNETKVTVYRDGEGRVRRETPNEISIWDPAAGTNYVLNPKTMTARKMKMNFVVSTKGPAPGEPPQAITMTYRVFQNDGGGNVDAIRMGETLESVAELKAGMAGTKIIRRDRGKAESLGTKVMEGVTAEGEMRTTTIDTGEIGNDRPIQSTMERWYSQDLQTVVMTRRNDPRTGEEIFKLTNIHRGEPAPVLFEVPPGYTVK